MAGPSFDRILKAAADQAGLSPDRLTTRQARATRYLTAARRRAILVSRRLRPDLSMSWLGGRLGGLDHTTVRYHERRAEALVGACPAEAAAVLAVCAELGVPALPARRLMPHLNLLDHHIAMAEQRLATLRQRRAELAKAL